VWPDRIIIVYKIIKYLYDLLLYIIIIFLVIDSKRVTPVPIPNTEVKSLCAYGTVREAAWESRSLPGFFLLIIIKILLNNLNDIDF
jgi:hypothetical protein